VLASTGAWEATAQSRFPALANEFSQTSLNGPNQCSEPKQALYFLGMHRIAKDAVGRTISTIDYDNAISEISNSTKARGRW
jgi:hypothetical protein